MLLLHEKYKPVVRVLLKAGCCCRCVLRFCCVGQQDPYKLPYEELVAELDQFASITVNITSDKPAEDVGPPCKKAKLEETKQGVEETQQNGEMQPHLENADSGSFKRHLGTCVVCLGILQQCCQKEFADQVCEKVNSAGYEFDSVAFSVSLPPQFSVREHALWLFIKQEVGQQLLKKEEIVRLKDVYKWIIHPLLSEELGVPMDSKSLFTVSVVFAHPKTDGDCHFLATFCPDCFRPAKNKQSVFTRLAVVKALEKIKDEDFCKHFPCPPSSSEMGCVTEEIQCVHAPVYIAGRYNKYSRTLPQTPWIIDGERKMESSVEELISEHLMPAFKVSHFNFSSSGREDVDVRTLGKGRPFAIELVSPHRASFTQEEIKALQQKINQSDKIKVRDLQMVTREAVAHMKKGEEEKTKSYSALIWTERAIQENDIQFLNELKELKIFQKTPLRVLHRRPLAVRTRLIHTMRTEYIDQHHFRFYLKTQAGTYIKEFVHGDFGRTKPNLGLLMKTTADILELDVESVDVDWPPALDN